MSVLRGRRPAAAQAAELVALREERDRLQARVRQLRKEAGGDDLGYLFVMTYGRSGSTLLGGLLNAVPGYLVRGENSDALGHLYDYHRSLAHEKATRQPAAALRRPTHPWFGIHDVPLDRSLVAIRRLVTETLLRPGPDTRVVGFKEIRWARPDLEAYVGWLREVFPGARFLVNTRAHESVLSSKWWAKGDPEQKAAALADIERRILAVAAGLGDAAYHVHYDDYVPDPTVLRGLYEWLGEPWDEASVRATMSVRHSV